MPPCASGPVFTVNRPSLNGAACAIAGVGNLKAAAATPAAVPAIIVRREILRAIAVLPECPRGVLRTALLGHFIYGNRSRAHRSLSQPHAPCRPCHHRSGARRM